MAATVSTEEMIALVARAQEGDVEAFEELVRAFQDVAVAYAYVRLGDFYQAEDAAQSSFLDAYQHLSQLREPAAFAGWLRQIVHKHCDRLRRGKRLPTADLETAGQVTARDADPVESALNRELREAVRLAVSALPRPERTVTALYYVSGWSQGEIGRFLGLSVTKVNNRLHAARRRLKESMLSMVQDDLHAQRPSRDERFAQRVLEILQAAGQGDRQRVQELLAQDARLANAKGAWDKTPLHLAAEKNHEEIARILLAAGADLEQLTSWGMTPLEWAANMGNRAVADALVAHGARLNLWAAAGLGMLDAVAAYWRPDGSLRPGAGQARNCQNEQGRWVSVPPPTDPIEIISDAFYIAARNGHVPVAEFLLTKGAEIDRRGYFGASGLLWAALNGHRAMVEFLVARGADIHLRDHQFHADSLGWAKEGGHIDIVEFLLAHGASMTVRQAAGLGRLDWVKSTLDANPDLLNSLEDQGPILHEAVLQGQLHMVEYLLARGADPNLKNAQGDTALSLALKATQGLTNPRRLQQHPDIVALLQKHGAVI